MKWKVYSELLVQYILHQVKFYYIIKLNQIKLNYIILYYIPIYPLFTIVVPRLNGCNFILMVQQSWNHISDLVEDPRKYRKQPP